MRTIFHVGHAKTGTTALQGALEASRGALIARGVLYPSNPNGSYHNHRLLFADLFEPHRVPRHVLKNYRRAELPAARAELCASVRREIEAHRPDCLVLSSESRFGVWSDAFREGFRRMLGEVTGSPEAEIVAYVRRPSSWYLSALQQNLKASHEIRLPRMIRLAGAVEQLASDFGRDRVHLRAFDRRSLAQGDVCADFVGVALAAHGVEGADLHRPEVDNHSLSAESFDVMRRWRLAFHPDRPNDFLADARTLNNALAGIEAELRPPRPVVDPDLAEVLDYCRDDLLRLRDGFGLVLPGYDYERVERGDLTAMPKQPPPLERIVTVDREVQARIVSRLGTKRWTEREPEYRRWLAALPGRIEAEDRERRGRPGAARPVAPAPWRPRPVPPGTPVLALGGDLAVALADALDGGAGSGLGDAPRIGEIGSATAMDVWTAWAAGEARPPEGMRDEGGRVHDLLRPGVAGGGFPSADAARSDREAALGALAAAIGRARLAVLEPVSTLAHLDAAGVEVTVRALAARTVAQDLTTVCAALTRTIERMRRMSPGLRILLLPPRAGPGGDGQAAVLGAATRAVAATQEDVERVPVEAEDAPRSAGEIAGRLRGGVAAADRERVG